MMERGSERDFEAELEALDRWLEGEDRGERPIEVLRARGLTIPDDDATLDDAALHATLWRVLEAMGEIGVIVEQTDHLSDRELYRYLIAEGLQSELLLQNDGGIWHISPLNEGADDFEDLYLRYYADDEDREQWAREFEVTLPPKQPKPFDRDRFMPWRSSA